MYILYMYIYIHIYGYGSIPIDTFCWEMNIHVAAIWIFTKGTGSCSMPMYLYLG